MGNRTIDSLQRSIHLRSIATYSISALLSTLVACVRLRCWEMTLNIPFRYNGDALWQAAQIKSLIETGWVTKFPFLGMPAGLSLYDYPILHPITYIILKPATIFIKDFAILMNIYFLATFPLVAISGTYVLRKLRVSTLPAILGGALYSLIPYHFLRAQSHLGLSGYYTVPLSVLVALSLFEFDQLRSSDTETSGFIPIRKTKILLSLASCMLIGLSHLYYVFFSAYTILVSGFSAALSQRKLKPFIAGILFITVILTVSLVSNIQFFFHENQHGANSLPLNRSPKESLQFGLEPTSLLIPKAGTGNTYVDELRQKHLDAHDSYRWAEGRFTYIGLIGIIGIVIMIIQFLRTDRHQHTHHRIINRLIINSWALIILGVVGGLGYGISLLGFTEIRCYNRVSIYLAFMGIAVFTIFLDEIGYRFRKSRIGTMGFGVMLIMIFLAGAKDQTTEPWTPEYTKIAR